MVYDLCLCGFFSEQKTAYEMRISDWSSDVCSADLHLARRLRVGGQLDHRLDRVADDVALPGGEEVHDEARGCLEGHTLGRGRGGVHEIEARALGGFLGRLQHVDDLRRLADLLPVAEGLLLAGGEARSEAHTSELQSLMRHSY